MPDKRKTLLRRKGLFIYVDDKEKQLIKEAAKRQHRTLTAYCRLAILKQVEEDSRS